MATISGTSFGSFGKGYVRFAYAKSVENIEAALEKARKACRSPLARAFC